MLRTDGGYGVPGMPGNGGQFIGNRPLAPGSSPYAEPSRDYLRDRYPFGKPPQPPEPRQEQLPVQLQLPLAGSSNLPNAIGNMAGLANAQFYGGPQMGQMPAGFQGKYVS